MSPWITLQLYHNTTNQCTAVVQQVCQRTYCIHQINQQVAFYLSHKRENTARYLRVRGLPSATTGDPWIVNVRHAHSKMSSPLTKSCVRKKCWKNVYQTVVTHNKYYIIMILWIGLKKSRPMCLQTCWSQYVSSSICKNTSKFLLMCRHINQIQKETYVMKDFVPAYIN